MTTGIFDEEVPTYGTLMTVEVFKETVDNGGFIDYDGCGYAVKDNRCEKIQIYPSEIEKIPEDATHIVWFNR